MADMLSTPGFIGAGLASIAAIAGGHGLPPPSGAFSGPMPASAAGTSQTPVRSIFGALRRWRRRPAAVPLDRLDDHTLRDIGLTRGMLLVRKPAAMQQRRRSLFD